MLQCTFKSVSVPKLGNAIKENEDNFLTPCTTEDTLLKFAISDGATEASFSKEWSDLLVTYYKDNSFEQDQVRSTLEKASKSWSSIANTVELPWYAQQKAEIGAFAAFLGITINREKYVFNSAAIGDCTLFQIRDNELIHSFPILKAEEFGNTPPLLSSNTEYQKEIETQFKYSKGEILPDDIIILATDAIAAWVLKGVEKEDKPWNSLYCLLSFEDYKTDFQNWLNNKRHDKQITNDDVTLIMIKFQ